MGEEGGEGDGGGGGHIVSGMCVKCSGGWTYLGGIVGLVKRGGRGQILFTNSGDGGGEVLVLS